VTQAAADDVRLLPEPLAGGTKLPSRFLQIMAAEIAHLDVLEMPPDALFWIQLRRIAGEALEMDPLSRPVAQILPDGFAAVDRRAILEDQQLARDMAPQVIQEADHLGARDRRLVDLEVQPPLKPDGADDRQMVAAERVMQDRRLAPRRGAARHRGQKIEAALIEEEQRAPVVGGLLF
jgi:hypothetical protein